MHRAILGLLASIVLAGSALVANAHHSFSATFKSNDKIEVEGIVTAYSFKNPHVNIYFDVTDADGSVTNWISEGGAATNMRRAGWSADSIQEGQRIRIFGDSTHDGSPMIAIDRVDILNQDGSVATTLGESQDDQGGEYAAEAGGPATPDPGGIGPEGRRLASGVPNRGNGGPDDPRGVRENAPMASVIPLTLEDGRPNLTYVWTSHGGRYHSPRDPYVSFTEAGAALQATFSDTNDPQVFCDDPGLIRQTGMTPHPIRITQYDDRVEFEYEEYAGKKVVYFDASQGQTGIPTHLGDSIARYEDNMLVVETRNLLPDLATAEGNQLSDRATATQYYYRIDEEAFGSMLMIRTVASDPVFLVDDLVLENVKMATEEQDFIDVECTTPLREREVVHRSTSFFLTSEGMGDGANLGGLEGADAHCEMLAESMGQGGKNWRAYLSTTGENSVNARDRIGVGPWYNAEGTPVATDVDDLHADTNNLTKATVLSERADEISGRGDEVNRHDILTGSLMDGTASLADEDTTCSNWTSNGEGSALVGHHDRQGGGQNPESWNSAHGSRGCSQENLQGTGGDGLFYCFAADPQTSYPAEVVSLLASGTASAPSSVSSFAPTVDPAQAQSSGTDADSNRPNILIVLAVVAGCFVVGFFLFRKKNI